MSPWTCQAVLKSAVLKLSYYVRSVVLKSSFYVRNTIVDVIMTETAMPEPWSP